MDKSTIDLLIVVGSYIAPSLLTQAIKKSFNIRHRWVPIIPFICAWFLLAFKVLSQNQPLDWAMFWGIIHDGVLAGAVSIALFNLYHKTVMNK